MEIKKWTGQVRTIVRLLQESALFAFSQLKGDKFRTFLSLFGVSVGIFSIVAILTAVDGLKKNVSDGLNSLGGDAVMISKFPMGLDEEDDDGTGSTESNKDRVYKFWEYLKRPSTSIRDYRFLVANSKLIDACSFMAAFQKSVKYKRNSISGCGIAGVAADWAKIANSNISEGRFFTQQEVTSGANVAVIGYEVARDLFGPVSSVGKTIKIGGFDILVIGEYSKQGQSIVNIISYDNAIFIPYTFANRFVNFQDIEMHIFAKPHIGVAPNDFVDELKVLMRAERRLKPGEKNNFSINQMSFLRDSLDSVLKSINIVGWIIAGFSLLIGGFGIANIMFVSVKERTRIIGIQKALGAKKFVILSQFLVESAFLSFIGGIIGILIVLIVILVLPKWEAFAMTLSVSNVIIGLVVSIAIGIISGVLPAYTAAKLDPVDAINSK